MRKVFSIVVAIAATSFVFGQNEKPKVSNVQAVKNPLGFTITYDLFDAEFDTCEVFLRASTDGGKTYQHQPIAATGDVGKGVVSGAGKTITWNASILSIPGLTSQIQFKIVADDGYKIPLEEIAELIDSTRIRQNFNKVYGNNSPANTFHYFSTRNQILNHYQNLGLIAEADTFFTNVPDTLLPAREGVNIYGIHSGLVKDSTVLMTGHYDTVEDTPGADDNNMSVAVCMEAATVLSQFEFRNNIQFANWDLEEIGLLGAYYYALSPRSLKTKSVINFDGISIYKEEPNSQKVPTGFDLLFPEGYAKTEADGFRGNFITMVTDIKSAQLNTDAEELAPTVAPRLKQIGLTCPDPSCLIATDLRRSDHAPFWDRGIPAIFFTSTTEFRSDCYHQPCDTNIALDFSTNVIRLAATLVAKQAGIMHAGTSTSAPLILGIDKLASEISKVSHPFPNPVSHSAFFQFSLATPQTAHIEIFSLDGKLIDATIPKTYYTGDQTIAWVPDRDLAKGTYLAVFHLGEKQHSFRLQVEIDPAAMHQHGH